jgi:hypothetical protein
MEFRPKVKVSSKYELVWLGRLGIPGLFDGKHRFFLEEVDENTTRLIQSERFSGILAPFVFLKVSTPE